MRLLPGPRFWTFVYLFVDFFGLWPYLAASAAVPLVAAMLGHLPGQVPTKYMPLDELSAKTGVEIRVLEDIKANPGKYNVPKKLEPGQAPLPQPLVQIMEREGRMRNYASYAIFASCFIPLIFGGKIYTVLERIMVVKVVLVLGYLLFLGLFYVSPGTWAEIFGGFVFLGKDAQGHWGFGFVPTPANGQPIDWALLGAFAAIAG